MPTIGTHNLHDETGVPTFFADAIGYTEAIPATIRARKRARWAKGRARLAGYTIRVCSHQRDLVMALRRRHWKVTGTHYHAVHGGVATVTPHRGTFAVETVRRKTGQREVFLLGHRINAAFPPYKRGEGVFRRARWAEHDQVDDDLIREYRDAGWVVHALGDMNTPGDERAWPALRHEVGHSYDRLASTQPLRGVQYLSRMGSDHPRLRATIDERPDP